MTVVVTGAAGFIGSTLVDELLDDGERVIGIDCFTAYYSAKAKWTNISDALSHPNFSLIEADLRFDDLVPILTDVELVFHQAAQPGVRLSWANGFNEYDSCNVLATQRLLEAAIAAGVRRVVYASSSSIYGNATEYPVHETDLPRPHSPYGVTKLAAEHLCELYAANYDLDVVSLRYFTVYGPRQRPDMAIYRLLESGITGDAFPLYGDGTQVRDFTYVHDVVQANLQAATATVARATVLNVCAGGSTPMDELVEVTSAAVGKAIRIDRRPAKVGDVSRTGGDNTKARELLGWEAKVSLVAGIAYQADWQRQQHARRSVGS